MGKAADPAPRNFAVNRQAQHLYHLLERFESGVELTGTEVKSIREGKVNLKDSYAVVKNHEVWLIHCHSAPTLPAAGLTMTRCGTGACFCTGEKSTS